MKLAGGTIVRRAAASVAFFVFLGAVPLGAEKPELGDSDMKKLVVKDRLPLVSPICPGDGITIRLSVDLGEKGEVKSVKVRKPQNTWYQQVKSKWTGFSQSIIGQVKTFTFRPQTYNGVPKPIKGFLNLPCTAQQ